MVHCKAVTSFAGQQRAITWCKKGRIMSMSGGRIRCQAADESVQPVHLRRDVLMSILLPSMAIASNSAVAEEASDLYTDTIDKFQMAVPSGWALGEGKASGRSANSTRRVVAIFPKDGNVRDTNATVVITFIAPDFTKLGSFGTPLDFGQGLVNSMDRSFLLKAALKKPKDDVPTAKLIDASTRRGMYYIEYKSRSPPEPTKHLASLVAVHNDGIYNRLYTLTVQCPEEEADKFLASPAYKRIIESFKVLDGSA